MLLVEVDRPHHTQPHPIKAGGGWLARGQDYHCRPSLIIAAADSAARLHNANKGWCRHVFSGQRCLSQMHSQQHLMKAWEMVQPVLTHLHVCRLGAEAGTDRWVRASAEQCAEDSGLPQPAGPAACALLDWRLSRRPGCPGPSEPLQAEKPAHPAHCRSAHHYPTHCF